MEISIVVTKPKAKPDILSYAERTELLVGRSSNATIRVDTDPMVSRKHALLVVDPPRVAITDLGSTNGIYVNKVKYGGDSGKNGEVELHDGDEVRLGGTFIRVTCPVEDDDDESLDRDAGWYSEANTPAIPGYAINRLLGIGGMGRVYLARKLDTGERVAIKVLAADQAVSAKRAEAFNREIAFTKSISHPNIVRFYAAGLTASGLMYLALEYVSGGDLGAFILQQPRKRLSMPMAFNFAVQAAEGMAYAHLNGIIHRDIKPQNLLLQPGEDGMVVKISDLGLAKGIEDAGFAAPQSSFASGGTMGYMPPEQLTDFRDTKPSADVFSLGATFYEMLCGQVPYNFQNEAEMNSVITSGDIIPIEERLPGLPEPLVVIIDRCLLPNPEDRYQNCGEMLGALLNVDM